MSYPGFWSVRVAFQVAVDQRIAVPSRLPLASQRPVPREVERDTVIRVSIQVADQSSRGDIPDLQWIGKTAASVNKFFDAEPRNQIFPIGRKRKRTDAPRTCPRQKSGKSVAPGNRGRSVPASMSHSAT